MMKRTLGLLGLLATVGVTGGACSSNEPANNSNATRTGVVETNSNVNPNLNGNTAPANTGVITNNNGNKNTAGVATDNANNRNSTPKNKNENK
jgi:hypothetical protein